MDSYSLSRNFWNWAFDNPEKISPNHSAIYFFAIEHCNRLGWKEKFGFPSQMTMDAIGIKKHSTYIRYFNDLVDWGFFELIQKSSNQYSANIISLTNALPKNGEALDKAMSRHGAKHTAKQKEYNKTIKQLNNEQTNKERYASFEKFKSIYPKHKGNIRLARDLWLDLDDNDIKDIFANVQSFVRNNIKFLPFSDNYIKDERWKDTNAEFSNKNKVAS